MDGDEEDASQLFQSLLGQVTEEQWETYKELRRVRGELVCDDDSSSDSSSTSPVLPASPIPESAGVTTTQELDMSPTADRESNHEGWKSELTVKYINGEITFTEFTDLMEQDEKDESLEQVESAEEVEKDQRKRVSEDPAAVEFEEELQKHKQMKKRKRRGRLPRDLQGLMGEANLCFARGDYDDATKMCMEIIRLVPTAPEPFQTLGMLYEEKGDTEKALQFSLIGAYLNPSDPEEWIKLAEMSLEQGNVKQAITCYSKAIKCDPTNLPLLWERCNLQEQIGDRKKALEGYEAIMELLGPDQGNECVQLAREIAKSHHENGYMLSAVQVLEKAFYRFPELITSEDVNMLLELQIHEKKYREGIKALTEFCGVQFVYSDEVGEENRDKEISPENAKECIIPELLPIDLRIKLAVCLIHVKALSLIKTLVQPLLEESPETMGDLYLDVAEAYMDIEEFTEALTFLSVLVTSQNYNLAAIWLRYAECLNSLGRIEPAIEAYQKVVQLAPSHLDARMSLSGLLQQMGKTREAIHTLKQGYEEGLLDQVLDVHVLIHRCNLLFNQELWDDYIQAAKLVMLSHCHQTQNQEEVNAVFKNLSVRRRLEALRDIRKKKDVGDGRPTFTSGSVHLEEMWKFYLQLCHKLYELKKIEDLQEVAFMSLTSPLFNKDPDRARDTEFVAFLASFYNRSIDFAYILIKDLVVREKFIDNVAAWNLFCQVVILGQDIRHNRFCLRLFFKHTDHIPLGLLNGHNALVAGSYKHALGEYMCVFKQLQQDPYVTFCIGLVFTHMACQKFATKRHSLVVQSCAFLNQYHELRGECQEVYYNLGRTMHQLGLLTTAVFYYKKALEFGPPSVDTGDTEFFDLSPDIAYNLSLIYQGSGAPKLATMYLQKYCVI